MVKIAHSLHLLAAPPSRWAALLPEIESLWQSGDQLLLLAEGAAGFNAAALKRFSTVAMLTTDADGLNLATTDLPRHIQLATMTDWAAWTLHYPRTITWR